MEISEITSLATGISQSRTAETVQLSVLKKAMDINTQSGLQLIQAASNAAPSNPPHLGSRIDTYA